MAEENLLQKIHGLSDLELAQLLCLVSRQHALISTLPEVLDELVEELQLISTNVFGLKCLVVDCRPHTTLDDFATSLLLPSSPTTTAGGGRSSSPLRTRHDPSSSASYFPHAAGRLAPLSPLTSTSSGSHAAAAGTSSTHTSGPMANVIIAKNLDRAPKAVQIQTLELLRSRRIFTRTAVHAAPKQFLFLGVLATTSGGAGKVTRHLNDAFAFAHWHDPHADGFANLEEHDDNDGDEDSEDEWVDAETASTESVVKKSIHDDGGSPAKAGEEYMKSEHGEPLFTDAEVARLAALSNDVQMDVDVLRYEHNVVSFLRMHRAVAGGITPTATQHLDRLVRCLAPMHRLDFVTPALVDLAVRKVYLHRIRVVRPEKERSLQWGSEIEAVRTLLEGIGPEDVIEDVLSMVTAPV